MRKLVFIPARGIEHLVSTVEIAKQLTAGDHQLFITVFIMKLPFNQLFINLPKAHVDTRNTNPSSFFKTFIENHKTHARDAVSESTQSESNQARLVGLVINMFYTTMIDVADEFRVPSYMFFTSNFRCLAFLLHLRTLQDENGIDAASLMDSKDRFREIKGILVNMSSKLESHALQSLSDGKTLPVYPVGPLLNLESDDFHVGSNMARQKYDDQLSLSVRAYALEHSRLRFLWSLRKPLPKGEIAMPSDYADPTGVLPEGFLDRTAEIGRVIGWAPQVAILAHPTIGGFVSHCGWNSMLEKQQLNTFELVKELGLAVEIKMDYRKGSEVVVSAEEIGRGIREVMEKDSDIRERVKEMSVKSKKALVDGGSSHSSLGCFIDQIQL
ncbi:hypothetical protein PRUPE_3G185400 [Prunus persica]|uniref:UDP-glycosyltransferases domain-containing protein n=1 Tax=Prunus persica TaxID=3760 RepID=A0A251Q243_PRUPE|nr:hypothetical protein PRUPE_3G185400 [Prunus persica]